MDDLDTRISTWLETIATTTASANILCLSSIAKNLDQARLSQKSLETISKKRTWSEAYPPLSPPDSSDPNHSHDRLRPLDRYDMSLSTPKRRRQETGSGITSIDHVQGVSRDAILEDETPRPKTKRTKTPSLADSETSSLSYQSSQPSNMSSPSKMLNALALNPIGVDHRTMDVDDADIPGALAELCMEMEMIATGTGVVAGHLETEIADLKKTMRTLSLFHPAVYTTRPDDLNAPYDVTLDQVLQIYSDAKNCYDLEQDESGWNNLVHTPLLRAGCCGKSTRGRQLVSFSPCITADILPTYRINNIPGRKIDYVLHIDPDKDQDQPITREATWALCRSLPDNTINHTSFAPLRHQPISVSIETKRSGEHEQKAKLQMGIWQSAQWRLLSHLAKDGLAQLPFIPGIVIQGHEWKLVATSYHNGKTTLWTGGVFGSTQTPLKAFQAIAGVYRLRRWTLEVFWPWYKSHILTTVV